MDQIVTVIIPSYNRGHLLKMTIPSYFQEGVKEVILVDDCSSDNTADVIKDLQQIYPTLKYIRQPKNLRQTAAKNRGLQEVTTSWVYFGDDDSMLSQGCIKRLYDTCHEYKADISGAIAYYMTEGEQNMDLEEYLKVKTVYAENVKEIVDLETMNVCFTYSVRTPIEVPFCQACVLMRSELAKKIKFDTNYIGNGYREETDFLVRCNRYGAKIMYDSRAAQVNLPSSLSTGGSRSRSKWKYKYYMIRNNWYFLNRNFDFLKHKYLLKTNKYYLQFNFVVDFIRRPIKRIINRWISK